jgi:hypothetical protein
MGGGVVRIDLPDALWNFNVRTEVYFRIRDTSAEAMPEARNFIIGLPVDAVLSNGNTPFNASTDTVTPADDSITAAKLATDAGTEIATAVWQDATAGDFTVAGSIGKSVFTGVTPGAAGGLFTAGTNAATTITSGTATQAALTLNGNTSGSGLIATGGSSGSGMTLLGGSSAGNGLYVSGVGTGRGVLIVGGDGTGGHGMELRSGIGTSDDLKLTNSDAPTLATAVWTSLLADSQTTGSFGWYIKRLYDKIVTLR